MLKLKARESSSTSVTCCNPVAMKSIKLITKMLLNSNPYWPSPGPYSLKSSCLPFLIWESVHESPVGTSSLMTYCY
jgi:hypothetical protein